MEQNHRYVQIGQHVIHGIYCLIFVFGLFANLWMVYLIIRYRYQLKTFMIILFTNLIAADLFVILTLPLVVANYVLSGWSFGWFVCKLYLTLDAIGKFGSVTFMCLVTIGRYIGVCHPVASTHIFTKKVAMVMIVAGWLLVCIFNAPIIYTGTTISDIYDDNKTATQIYCLVMWVDENSPTARIWYTASVFVLLYLIPLLIICICHSMIIIQLKRNEKVLCRKATLHQSRNRSPMQRCKIWRYVTLMSIVTFYTICWLPYWIIQFGTELGFNFLKEYERFMVLFSLSAYCMQFLNSALNPVIYGIGIITSNENGQTRKKGATQRKNEFHCRRIENNTAFESVRCSTSV